MRLRSAFAGLFVVVTAPVCAAAAAMDVTLHRIDSKGIGEPIGTVRLGETPQGLRLHARLDGLIPGPHGFHVHERGACGPQTKDGAPTAGLAAGGHYDPDASGRHEGPAAQGHRGDLPVLVADAQGRVRATVTAPRLRLADVRGRALMVHAGGDNYADRPQALGGGGARVACGVVPGQPAPAR